VSEVSHIACMILCAGKSQRMGATTIPKPCFEFGGEPAINRCISNFKSAGLTQFVVVVGHEAEHLMRTVSSQHSDVLFAYQRDQRGTGHAVRCGLVALRGMPKPAAVLIAMGDKLIHTSVAATLVQRFKESQADLTFVVLPKDAGTDLGRIVLDGRRVLGDVEAKDIAAARLWRGLDTLLQGKQAVSREELRAALRKMLGKARLPRGEAEQLKTILKSRRSIEVCKLHQVLWAHPRYIQLDGRSLSPEQAETLSPYVNAALYLFKWSALRAALDHVEPRGAKGEEYLTGGLNYLASARGPDGQLLHAVQPVPLKDPRLLLSFNTVPQLRRARQLFTSYWPGLREPASKDRPA